MALITEKFDNINYQIYIPTSKYSQIFKSIIEIKGIPFFSKERIIPSNGPELLINLNETIFGKFQSYDESVQQGEFIVSGNRFNYFDSIVPQNAHYIIIKFTNFGFNRLLKIPLSNISDIYIKNLKENNIKDMIFKLSESLGFQERINVVQNWIDGVYIDSDKFSLSEYIEPILIGNPQIRSDELEKLTGYSAKYLNKKFKSYSGYTISNFKRLSRFHKTLNHLKHNQETPWTELVYTSNYYDQSHFIKELVAFTGLTPSKLKANMKKDFHNLVF